MDLVLRNNWPSWGEYLLKLIDKFWRIILSFLDARTLVVQVFVGFIFMGVGFPQK